MHRAKIPLKPLLLCIEERASWGDSRIWSERLWIAPCRAILDMSDWEETSGQTKNPLEGEYILCGQGIPGHPPGRAVELGWVEGCLGILSLIFLLRLRFRSGQAATKNDKMFIVIVRKQWRSVWYQLTDNSDHYNSHTFNWFIQLFYFFLFFCILKLLFLSSVIIYIYDMHNFIYI